MSILPQWFPVVMCILPSGQRQCMAHNTSAKMGIPTLLLFDPLIMRTLSELIGLPLFLKI